MELPLREAVRFALENSPSVTIASGESSRPLLDRDRASSVYWPRWKSTVGLIKSTAPSVFETDTGGSAELVTDRNLTFSTGIAETAPTDTELFVGLETQRTDTTSANVLVTPYYFSRFTISGTQHLLRGYDWFGNKLGNTWSTLKIASRNQSASEYEFQDAVTSVVAKVEMEYWNVVASLMVMNTRKEAGEVTERQLEVTKRRIEAGLVVAAESFHVEERLASRQGDFLVAEREYQKARIRLQGLLNLPGEKVGAGLKPTEPLEYENLSLTRDEVLQEVERRSFRLRSLQEKAEARKLEMLQARNLALPVFDVTGSYFFNGGTTQSSRGYGSDLSRLFDTETSGYEVAAVLEIPLGRNPDAESYRMAKLEHEIAILSLTRERIETRTRALEHLEQLEASKRVLEAARLSVDLAQKKLNFEQKKYEAGLTPSFTVLEYHEDLTDARLKEISALQTYKVAVIALESFLGRTLDKFGIEIDQEKRRWTAVQKSERP